MDLGKYDLGQVASLCQTLLVHTGKTDDHEVYLYREGFYRGSSAAYLLLAVAICLRSIRGGTQVIVENKVCYVPTGAVVTTALIAVLLAAIFYQRYLRFASYRLQNLLNFPCMPEARPSSKELEDAPKEESSQDD